MKKGLILILITMLVGIFIFSTAQGPVFRLRMWDTDSSNYTEHIWNEDDSSNRAINWVLNSANRAIDLSDDLTVSASSGTIDQDISSGSSPTLDGTNFTGIDISDATNLAVDANELTLTGDSLGLADHATARSAIGLGTADDVQHADLYLTDCIGQDFYDEGSENSAFTIDWNNSNFQKVTITGAALDITFTEPPHAGRYLLMIIQGDGNDTLDWEHEVSPKWPGNVEPTLSTGAGDIDIIVFFFDGSTTYYGLASLNFE